MAKLLNGLFQQSYYDMVKMITIGSGASPLDEWVINFETLDDGRMDGGKSGVKDCLQQSKSQKWPVFFNSSS